MISIRIVYHLLKSTNTKIRVIDLSIHSARKGSRPGEVRKFDVIIRQNRVYRPSLFIQLPEKIEMLNWDARGKVWHPTVSAAGVPIWNHYTFQFSRKITEATDVSKSPFTGVTAERCWALYIFKRVFQSFRSTDVIKSICVWGSDLIKSIHVNRDRGFLF